MVPQWIIEKKRDGVALSKEEIEFFINGYTAGDIPDYQMAALAMAIYLKGMNFEETAALTYTMMNSGDLLDTSSISIPKVDKHSTGGIGDKVSLILAPLMACCEVAVPMISGRGLGITGGTLDKMESIHGFRVGLSEDEVIATVKACGVAMVGQTGEIAPADKKLYALRDVTATVPSIPLITASIMCKKLAEGIDALVLDVKWGKGAFMSEKAQAQELASTMVKVGKEMGKGVTAILTDMNQPLGRTAGNALEVIESVEALKGNGPDDLMEVTLTLCAHMLMLSGKAHSEKGAIGILQGHIDSGAALDKFKKMVELQGGDSSLFDDYSKFDQADIVQDYPAPQTGYVQGVDAESIGRGVLVLGAGRQKTSDPVDFAVGISELKKIGEQVQAGDTLLKIHANSQEQLTQAIEHFDQAFTIGDAQPDKPILIHEIIKD